MLNNPFFDILRDSDEFKVALQKPKGIYDENFEKVWRDISVNYITQLY